MNDGMDHPDWDNGREVKIRRLTRERDEAQEEVAASLDALMALQIKHDEGQEMHSLTLICSFVLGSILMALAFWFLP